MKKIDMNIEQAMKIADNAMSIEEAVKEVAVECLANKHYGIANLKQSQRELNEDNKDLVEAHKLGLIDANEKEAEKLINLGKIKKVKTGIKTLQTLVKEDEVLQSNAEEIAKKVLKGTK